MASDVYLAYDADGRLLYVGFSTNLATRVGPHRANSRWWPLVRRLEVEHFLTVADARDRERELIRTLQPPFNVDGVEPRPSRTKPKKAPTRQVRPAPAVERHLPWD